MAAITEMNFDHLIGQEVGTATLLKELGRGAMAVIFIAYQRTLKRQIAVKILPKSLLTPENAALFQQEAETAAILSHPNIIPIYEVGVTEEFLFFTMQLVQGRPLSYFMDRARRHVIPSKRVFPVKTAVKLILAVLDGLSYAHSQDIVHRDIKPSNILIETHTKRPIIMDFGIAKSLRESETIKSGVMGTPLYLAPEQILGKSLDGRADIYATGIVLFQMLVADLPLASHETTRELLRLKLQNELFVRRPSELNSALHEDMDRIIFKTLALDPEDRYRDCQELSEEMQSYADKFIFRPGERGNT